MISQGNVSLRDARADCGLSPNGNMKVVEFSDRTNKANPSLTDLRGTVLCLSSKATTGNYHDKNYNPGSACRPNYCEANTFSLGQGTNPYGTAFQATLSQSGKTSIGEAETKTDHDTLAGFSYVGVGDPNGGNYQFRIYATENGPDKGQVSIEVIGWTSGFFAGSANYYENGVTFNGLNTTLSFYIPGSHRYITACVQAHSWLDGFTGTRSKAPTYECRMWKL